MRTLVEYEISRILSQLLCLIILRALRMKKKLLFYYFQAISLVRSVKRCGILLVGREILIKEKISQDDYKKISSCLVHIDRRRR